MPTEISKGDVFRSAQAAMANIVLRGRQPDLAAYLIRGLLPTSRALDDWPELIRRAREVLDIRKRPVRELPIFYQAFDWAIGVEVTRLLEASDRRGCVTAARLLRELPLITNDIDLVAVLPTLEKANALVGRVRLAGDPKWRLFFESASKRFEAALGLEAITNAGRYLAGNDGEVNLPFGTTRVGIQKRKRAAVVVQSLGGMASIQLLRTAAPNYGIYETKKVVPAFAAWAYAEHFAITDHRPVRTKVVELVDDLLEIRSS